MLVLTLVGSIQSHVEQNTEKHSETTEVSERLQ